MITVSGYFYIISLFRGNALSFVFKQKYKQKTKILKEKHFSLFLSKMTNLKLKDDHLAMFLVILFLILIFNSTWFKFQVSFSYQNLSGVGYH